MPTSEKPPCLCASVRNLKIEQHVAANLRTKAFQAWRSLPGVLHATHERTWDRKAPARLAGTRSALPRRFLLLLGKEISTYEHIRYSIRAKAIPRSTANGRNSGSSISLSHMGAVGSWGASMGCNSQGIPSIMATEGNSATSVLIIVRFIMGVVFEAF